MDYLFSTSVVASSHAVVLRTVVSEERASVTEPSAGATWRTRRESTDRRHGGNRRLNASPQGDAQEAHRRQPTARQYHWGPIYKISYDNLTIILR